MAREQWIRDRFPILLKNRHWGSCEKCGRALIFGQERFCSTDCYGKYRRSLRPEAQRICIGCNKKFRTNPAYIKRRKNGGMFCSRLCWRKYVADKPNNDKYGRSGKLPDKEWQKLVRQKNKNRCQRCGQYQIYIHTHHIRPRSRFPELKHDVSNGICLCNSCHTWVHHHPKDAHEAGLFFVRKYGSTDDMKHNRPDSKKNESKKPFWAKKHQCVRCKQDTSLILCEHCGQMSVSH